MKNCSCLCGGVKYQVKGKPTKISLCHCRMCQKFSGFAFGSFMRVPTTQYKLIKGANLETVYESSDFASRVFCSRCGSSLRYIFKAAPDQVFLAAGLLDDDPEIRPQNHIFVKNKADWFSIEDSLPQFEDFKSSVDS